jgi:hypothetical protein
MSTETLRYYFNFLWCHGGHRAQDSSNDSNRCKTPTPAELEDPHRAASPPRRASPPDLAAAVRLRACCLRLGDQPGLSHGDWPRQADRDRDTADYQICRSCQCRAGQATTPSHWQPEQMMILLSGEFLHARGVMMRRKSGGTWNSPAPSCRRAESLGSESARPSSVVTVRWSWRPHSDPQKHY